MIDRTGNPNHEAYDHYGGRGIKVCERWLDFANFFSDMGERPEGTSIDRIDNDLGYFKENCKWSTQLEQNHNKSSNVLLTHNGKTQDITQWALEIGVNRQTLFSRYYQGKSAADILSTSKHESRWYK